MPNSEKSSSQERESENITWRVVPLNELPGLLAHTLMETIFQNVAAVNSNSQLYRMLPTENVQGRDKTIGRIEETSFQGTSRLRLLMELLKQIEKDPTTPIPISDKYLRTGTGFQIIALDAINPPIPPASEPK